MDGWKSSFLSGSLPGRCSVSFRVVPLCWKEKKNNLQQWGWFGSHPVWGPCCSYNMPHKSDLSTCFFSSPVNGYRRFFTELDGQVTEKTEPPPKKFFVPFLGWLSDPFQRLSDLQLGINRSLWITWHEKNTQQVPFSNFQKTKVTRKIPTLLLQSGPQKPVVNGVKWGHYKLPEITMFSWDYFTPISGVAVFHPQGNPFISGLFIRNPISLLA